VLHLDERRSAGVAAGVHTSSTGEGTDGVLVPPMHSRICDHNRQLIIDHRFLLGDDETPAVVALPRRDLHRILPAAAEDGGCQVRLDADPVGLTQDPDGVEVTFADGSADAHELVVGFDGFRSWTRRQLFGAADDPVYSGYAAWRLIVRRPPEVTAMEFYQGPGSKRESCR
jgi:2-polyprenyl-6-methoxyphenol hydroxylase-like FAD-dependent oxidoreductase